MFIAPADATSGEDEWRSFVTSHPFGHLVAPGGPGRDLPVVVPTQFVFEDRTVWLHLVHANPIFERAGREPKGAAECGRRLGLHPVVMEGHR